jgi:hypothetical protein
LHLKRHCLIKPDVLFSATSFLVIATVTARQNWMVYWKASTPQGGYCDPGEGFSFEDLPQAAISNPPDDPIAHIAYRSEHGLRAGGFGVMIVRDLVDELYYNDKGNEVLLIKHLD